MKNILFYIPAILHMFLSAQAMEDNKKSDLITVNVLNTHYPFKTEFAGTFTYTDKTQKTFSLILDEFVDELPPPEKHTSLPYGEISNIELLLLNYSDKPDCPDEPDSQDRENTLIADLRFDPHPSVLKEITFTIKRGTISHTLPTKNQ